MNIFHKNKKLKDDCIIFLDKIVLQYNHRNVALADFLDTALTWGNLIYTQKPFSYGVNDLTFIYVTHASILTPIISKQ
jgi:hypothetical protein